LDRTALIGKIITITPITVQAEPDYIEAGMKARVLSVNDSDPEVTILTIDVGSFSEFNQALETSNYYDAKGVPCLTAREAGHYRDHMDIYVGPMSEIEEWIKLDTDNAVASLMEDFSRTRDGDEPYLAWLERNLIAARTH